MTDDIDGLFGNLRRSPFGGDLSGQVIGQDYSVDSIPGGIAEDLYFPPDASSYWLGGLANSNFMSPPPDPTGALDDLTNKLPGWSFVQSTGTGVTAALVADSTAGSGYKLRFSTSAAPTGDESYIEQVVPVRSSKTQNTAHQGYFSLGGASGTYPQAQIELQYLKADGTTTGSATTSGYAASGTVADYGTVPTSDAPADASALRIRIYCKAVGAGPLTGTSDLYEVTLIAGAVSVVFPELTTPASYAPGRVRQLNGRLRLAFGTGDQYYLSGHLVPVPFFEAGVSANSTINISPVDGGYDRAGTGFPRMPLPWSGSIVGVSLALSDAITAGNIDVKVTVGGTSVWTAISGHTGSGTAATQDAGTDTFAASDRIGVQLVTSAAFAPTTTDAAVLVWLLVDY